LEDAVFRTAEVAYDGVIYRFYFDVILDAGVLLLELS